jgi:hypothetical protein
MQSLTSNHLLVHPVLKICSPAGHGNKFSWAWHRLTDRHSTPLSDDRASSLTTVEVKRTWHSELFSRGSAAARYLPRSPFTGRNSLGVGPRRNSCSFSLPEPLLQIWPCLHQLQISNLLQLQREKVGSRGPGRYSGARLLDDDLGSTTAKAVRH